jgi:5-oxoprolinase (ATP-hydrolysing)
VTDANVMVGKIQPAQFPAIFGPDGDQPLDAAIVREKFAELAGRMGMAPEAVAEGFLRVAVSNMAHAIKQVSLQRGYDVSKYALTCFGGAGGQHACLVADELGMETVFLHPFAGVLSAYGMGLADQAVIREAAIERPLTPGAMPELRARLDALEQAGRAELARQGADPARLVAAHRLHLRYAGTDSFLPVAMAGHDAVLAAFTEAHRARFGFATPERQVVVEAALAEVTMPGEAVTEATLAPRPAGKAPPELGRVRLFCAGAHHDAPVLDREALLAGDHISGPALIREAIATTVIEPGWTGEVTSLNHLILRRTEPRAAARNAASGQVDPVMLELFNSLFMSIAEQTGWCCRTPASA